MGTGMSVDSRPDLSYGHSGSEHNDPHCVSSSSTNELAAFNREKKKKFSGFATLRKKLIGKRRSSKMHDHGRQMREFVSDWGARDIVALTAEFEALATLKELVLQADTARPLAQTYHHDLSVFYDYKYCTDVDLVFQGVVFPVHRALLSVRCPYFREVLKKYPGFGVQIGVSIHTPGVDVPMFSALLRYLYTGDFNAYEARLDNIDLLLQLGEEFGTPNPLEQDLRHLLETGNYADSVLVFTSGMEFSMSSESSSDLSRSDYGFHHRLELPCHKPILSARSPFFRNLIQRRQRSGEEMSERAFHTPTRIVLDESVIPKRYAHVLLHALYLDVVDINVIIQCSGSVNSLSEAQSIVNMGRTHLTTVEEAMELYQIGRFLELDVLTQGSEDIIIGSLTLDNASAVLRWSEQPHGSSWVHRQSLHFLQEDFNALLYSPVLYDLDKNHFISCLKSDFLQASELEVLQAVLKWGEQQLIKRIEEREPNLLNHTTHSVTKKGIKKRDLNDIELREILSELLPLVRMDHVIPPNHDTLLNAIKRGLVSIPPSHMIGDDTCNYRVNAWIRGKNNGLFVKPRLFYPYAEEIKNLVDDQMVQNMEMMHLHCHISHIPDTLYMVEDRPPALSCGLRSDTIHKSMPVMPNPGLLSAMMKRLSDLKKSVLVQRALFLPLSSRHDINRQLRLRVVREFNMPDYVAQVLEEPLSYQHEMDMASLEEEQCLKYSPRHFTSVPSLRHHYSLELPAFISERDSYRMLEIETSSCSDGHLSDIMPDVALATGTVVSNLPPVSASEMSELQLDLGDGTSHYSHHNTDSSLNRHSNTLYL